MPPPLQSSQKRRKQNKRQKNPFVRSSPHQQNRPCKRGPHSTYATSAMAEGGGRRCVCSCVFVYIYICSQKKRNPGELKQWEQQQPYQTAPSRAKPWNEIVVSTFLLPFFHQTVWLPGLRGVGVKVEAVPTSAASHQVCPEVALERVYEIIFDKSWLIHVKFWYLNKLLKDIVWNTTYV